MARPLAAARHTRLGRTLLAAAMGWWLAAGASAAAGPEQPVTIEGLMRDGWEVAGYVAVSDKRSLILFRHKELKYLVQCSVLVDVMRTPRLVTNCNELK